MTGHPALPGTVGPGAGPEPHPVGASPAPGRPRCGAVFVPQAPGAACGGIRGRPGAGTAVGAPTSGGAGA